MYDLSEIDEALEILGRTYVEFSGILADGQNPFISSAIYPQRLASGRRGEDRSVVLHRNPAAMQAIIHCAISQAEHEVIASE
jgi:hypothetical protein